MQTEKQKTFRMAVLASIPIILAILETVLWFTNLEHDSVVGGWVLNGNFSFLAVMGFFFLPFVCLIMLIVGLILSLKAKHTVLTSIFAVELLLDLTAVVFSVREFYNALSI